MEIKGYKLNDNSNIKHFDCGDADLNEFLFEKAKDYQRELLATTFVFENDAETLAYYSIMNDSMRIADVEFGSKNAIKNFLRNLFPHPKRHLKSYPAVKIGRLAISVNAQKLGLGSKIIDAVIAFVVNQNEQCACKFILVDAYKNAVGFYEKMQFRCFSDSDLLDETRQMYLDITPIINAKKI